MKACSSCASLAEKIQGPGSMADLCKGIWVVVNFQLGSLFGSLLYSGTYYLKKGTLILTTTHIKASHKEPEDCTFFQGSGRAQDNLYARSSA